MPPSARGVQTSSGTPKSPRRRPSYRVEVPLECDWSEHSCPDGFKYYYNCITYGLSSTEVLPQPNILSKKLEVQSSSAELDCMRLQSKPSPVVIPACV
ncbi:hypothetical protein SDJN02_19893, partial [Cucurbita argyrosperma subsp. argyrosperma]